jgi:hypothetical protein
MIDPFYTIESSGMGQALAEHVLILKGWDTDECAYVWDQTHGTVPTRIVGAASHVTVGRVQLARCAHEKIAGYT